jgi:hypothetical protein
VSGGVAIGLEQLVTERCLLLWASRSSYERLAGHRDQQLGWAKGEHFDSREAF